MKNIPWRVGTGLSLLLMGCLGIPEENGSVTGSAGMTINNDASSLGVRFTARKERIHLENPAGGLLKGAVYDDFIMTLIAEIDPPQVNGGSLQASSVSLSGGYAYISYNTAGEAYAGGVDVVRLNSGTDPEIVSSVVYDSADVHSLYYRDGELYLAEAAGDQGVSAAVVERMRVEEGKLQWRARERTVLNSFAATAVTVSGDRVFATSGNTGGLHALSREVLGGGAAFAAGDARWVDTDDSRVVVVQGMPGRISVYDKAKLTLTGLWPFTGADIPESKTTVRLVGGKALIAAGTGGVQLMNLATGKIVGSVAVPEIKGMDASQTVANAADGAGDLIYASNGEAGVYAIEASGRLEDVTGDKEVELVPLGRLAFQGLESVNHVAFDGNILVLATGRGGVKIVSVKMTGRVTLNGVVLSTDIE
jgi:hypothetical protein